jgi:cell wall-associated NlpC family hydrolase
VPFKVNQMKTQTASRISIFALTITMLALMTACSSQPATSMSRPQAEKGGARSQGVGDRAAAIAIEQVGVPYRYGGTTTSGFDCSGLVQYSYRHAGKNVPRTTGQLWSSTISIGRDEIQAGDLLFFSIEGKMSHVGLYVGKQQFVHAPSSGRTVTLASLTSPYYATAFVRAGRPR